MNTAAEWNHSLHERLVDIIQSRLGRDRHAKSQLASSIGITNSVFYKRLSSHSSFTIGELVMLAKHFNISIDEWIYDKSQIAQVRLLSWHQPVSGIESYLQQLIGWIKKLQSIPDHQVRYATREVPGLYYFMNPMLGAFKLYTFARFSWDLPGYRNEIPFSMGLFSEYQQELMSEVWNLYSKVPSEEIWNPNIWDTTLQQIIFLLEERVFKNQEDALALIIQIESVISACRQMAEQSKKSGLEGGRFTVYNNRVLHTNNIILAGNQDQKMIFITHDNPNFIYSEDEELYKYSDNWLDKLKMSGQLMSGPQNPIASEYFRTLQNKVDIAKRKIRGLISRDDEML